MLRYHDDGTLAEADLDRIAAVTSADTEEYLASALAHAEGHKGSIHARQADGRIEFVVELK